jgi:D-alanine-D-alanine ligase
MITAAAKRAQMRWVGRTVGVLLGGLGPERLISLKTGRGVAQALDSRGHRVVEVDARRDLPQQLQEAKVDVAFISLHGARGEGGVVQGVLECLGMPYTHSSMVSSALCMDKGLSKGLLGQGGLATPRWQLIRRRSESFPQPDPDVLEQLGFPVVVKPSHGGSSQHLSMARDAEQLSAAVALAAQAGGDVLVEEHIAGPELTVAVIEGPDGRGSAMPIVAIEPVDGWFDFEHKYEEGRTVYRVPAPIDDELRARVQAMAVDCYELHGCSGVARVDFMVDPERGPQIIEINSVPGMTATSLVPMAAAALGVDYPTLCEALLGLARCHLVLPEEAS